uniref:Hemicentin-1 n=1 Tax=Meloidogyne hapla TaxID=6305 RepID=A0A1I8B7J6_MELHA
MGCAGESFQNDTCISDTNSISLDCPIKGGEASVDGQWGKWHPCSVSCGIGFQFRERMCSDKPCPGGGKQARTCHAQWTNWSSWTFCSTCSVFETRKRHRKCVVQVAKTEENEDWGERELGNEACNGAPIEFDTCERSCVREGGLINGTLDDEQKSERRFSQTTSPLENRHWTDWGEWSVCSVSCGPNGRQSRTRKCKYNLVFLCDEDVSREERDCGEPKPPECKEDDLTLQKRQIIYPSWSDWSDWSACSCFSLTRYRRRFCRIHDPQLKGFCPGSIIEQSPCTLPNNDDPMQCAAVVGGWSSWSEWSQCSQDCGQKGHRVRNRMCANPLPSNRGAYCVGFSFDQTICDPPRTKCQGSPVDGHWSEWSDWSQCSNPCINGQRSRARYCSNPRPKNGGRNCSGSDFELQACSEPTICGLSLNNTSLFNNSLSSSTSLKSPQWSSWTDWSNCSSESCGFALRRRNRQCILLENDKSNFCEGVAHQSMECGNGRACEIASINGHWSDWSDWSSNCEWSGCIGLDPKNENKSDEEKNDFIQQFFEGTGDDLIDDELPAENNLTLINALAQAQMARTLNIRTRCQKILHISPFLY